MMDNYLQQIKESWNSTADSEWYCSLRTEEKIAELVQHPVSAFHPDVWTMLNTCFPDLHGKKILVPSSGDNHAAIAFALSGGAVTSADISERQLVYASKITEKLDLPMTFVCEDTMQLSQMEDETFDLVYTSNGTHTWIRDLNSMYRNICRVLKPGGYSVMYDIHPFQRPFTGDPWQEPKIRKSYNDTMPNCHWRVQDLINAMTDAGLTVEKMAELPAVDASFWYSFEERKHMKPEDLEGLDDWRQNPMPLCLHGFLLSAGNVYCIRNPNRCFNTVGAIHESPEHTLWYSIPQQEKIKGTAYAAAAKIQPLETL